MEDMLFLLMQSAPLPRPHLPHAHESVVEILTPEAVGTVGAIAFAQLTNILMLFTWPLNQKEEGGLVSKGRHARVE